MTCSLKLVHQAESVIVSAWSWRLDKPAKHVLDQRRLQVKSAAHVMKVGKSFDYAANKDPVGLHITPVYRCGRFGADLLDYPAASELTKSALQFRSDQTCLPRSFCRDASVAPNLS